MANGTNKGGKQRHEDKGIRTTTCKVCGEEVTHRKSVAIEGGRVCKSHSIAQRQQAINFVRMRKGMEKVYLAA